MPQRKDDEQDEPEQDEPEQKPARRRDTRDTNTDVDVAIQRHQSARRAVRALLNEADDFRLEIAGLRKKRQEVPVGGIILPKEDADRWAEYQKIGLDPADITTAIAERNTYKGRVDEADESELARAAGYKPSLLTPLIKAKGAKLERRDVTETVDGKKVVKTVVHVVTGSGDSAKSEPLDEYAARTFKDDLDSLKAAKSVQKPTDRTTRRPVTGENAGPQSGTPRTYHAQSESGDTTDDADAAMERYTEKYRVRPSQLRQKGETGRSGAGTGR